MTWSNTIETKKISVDKVLWSFQGLLSILLPLVQYAALGTITAASFWKCIASLGTTTVHLRGLLPVIPFWSPFPFLLLSLGSRLTFPFCFVLTFLKKTLSLGLILPLSPIQVAELPENWVSYIQFQFIFNSFSIFQLKLIICKITLLFLSN